MKRLRDTVFFPLCRGEHRKSQILFIFDGILINAAVVLTTGIFLSGYMVTLQADDFLIGILNSSPTWALIISLFSFLIFEKMEQRKKLLISMNIVSRLLSCSVVYLPFLIKNPTTLLYLTSFMVIAGNLIWSVYSVGIIVWMVSLLPNNQNKSRYIYLRMFYLRISFTVFSLVMGLMLDLLNKSLTGFVIVFTVSLILSLADAIVLMKTHEPKNKVDQTAKNFQMSWFLEPLKNKEYRKFLVFMFGFFFSLTLSSSYTPLYQIKYLALDYSFISIISLVANVSLILGTQLWSRVELKKGLYFVLGLTAFLLASEFFLYGFMTQKTIFLLFITPFLAGLGNSGFNVATVNYRYSLIPEDGHKTIYEGWYGAVLGLSSLLGPTVGNIIRNKIPTFQNSIFQFSGFQIMYLFSFVSAAVVVYLMFFRYHRQKSRSRSSELYGPL